MVTCSQSNATTRAELRTSVTRSGLGLSPLGRNPSARRPCTAAVDGFACGSAPRAIARRSSPRSAASLLKYAVAMTLFAAPCSHTKTTCARGEPDRHAEIISANAIISCPRCGDRSISTMIQVYHLPTTLPVRRARVRFITTTSAIGWRAPWASDRRSRRPGIHGPRQTCQAYRDSCRAPAAC